MRSLATWMVLPWLAATACASRAEPATATMPLEAPRASEGRNHATLGLGRALFLAMTEDRVESLVLDDLTLRSVLQPEAAARASVLRLNLGRQLRLSDTERALLRRATYRGACLQDVRHEPAGGVTGLSAPGWVVGRILVVGQLQGGGKVAAWVEGAFVYTDAGFAAAFVERVEAPRRDHADLQIATCDLRPGLD